MKLTSKDANKLLNQLNDELASLNRKEEFSKTFIAATSEDIEKVRPDYDYETMRNELESLKKKIIKLKHAINKFNVETTVPGFDLTIDEMLVYIPQLTAAKQKYRNMKDQPKMERVISSRLGNIIEYTYINYDADKVAEDYKKVEAELSRAQIALDKVNVSETFDVEL